jgi:hypothetical protein
MGGEMSAKALQDLFRRHREKATGLWKLGQEPSRTIYFDSGDIVFAQSTHPMDRLTHLLVERGKLTQTQLDYALANLKPGISIGKNLIEMGFITQRDLLEVARAQVERVVSGALATPDLEPLFEAKELDAHVVRLPFDTPELLLNGLLGLKDREGLLELLGPLNQVVVLQGRRLMEMALPADLAKLPPLLDGTHTLLELSRESLAEPLRLGTFALFLREMGWARLHEMPPMDRSALDLALAPELEALSSPLPEIETVPSLFSSIQAAAKPTTNLEHLSQAFDALPEPDPLPDPWKDRDDSGFSIETGRAILPTPTEVPVVPELPPEEEPRRTVFIPEPAVTILPSTITEPEPPRLENAPEFSEEPTPRRRTLVLATILGLVALGGVGFLGWNRLRHRGQPASAPAVTAKKPESSAKSEPRPAAAEPPRTSIAVPESAPPEKPAEKPVPKPVPPPAAEPKPTPSREPGASPGERAEALRKGDLPLAVRQGQKLVKDLPHSHWTLRLEIACQPETLRRAVELFEDPKPDLWVAPLTMRDGRGCYQVFYSHFASQAMAEKAIRKLPASFRTLGNRPKSFKIGEIAVK